MSSSSLISRLAAAVAADEPEQALAAAVACLANAGLVPRGPDQLDPPWLELTHRGRTVALHADGEPPAPDQRAVIADLLRVALARAVDHDVHRRLGERMEMLSAASFEGIMVHVDGVIIDANQRLADMLGYDRAEVLGDQILRRCVAPEDLAFVLTRMRDRVEGEYVITGVRRDGSRFRAELLSKQGRLGDHPVRIAAVRDVTERERTSAQLRESELRLRGLVEQAFDFFVFSRDGVVVDVGGRIEEVLGYPPAHFVGRRVLDFVAPSSTTLAARMIAAQAVGVFPSSVLDVHGEEVPVEVVAVHSTLGGEPVRVTALRDLRAVKRLERERRKLEQRLERGQRMESLGVLAGGIAHDFNNLLVGVLGNASLLLERATAPVEREAIEAIVAAGQRAASLTGQMLAYAGRGELGRREPVDVGALVHELRTLLAAGLSKKAHLELDLEPRSVVIGNRATLTQVVMNLLTNASDALEDHPGRIEVTTRRLAEPDRRWDEALGPTPSAGDWLLLEVRDTGKGMDDATRDRIFEPFFSTKAAGHGLGLAACFGIVAAHGGAILVDSAVGQGSRFSILLPAGELTTAPPPPVAAPSPTGRKVLVIDDEPLVRSVVRRGLEQHGYVVAEAADGATALARFAEVAADVVLLDLTMPDVDGLEVARRIRATGSRVPIVLSSGYLDALADRPRDRALLDRFLTKPFSMSELVAALEGAIAEAAARP